MRLAKKGKPDLNLEKQNKNAIKKVVKSLILLAEDIQMKPKQKWVS